MAEGVSFLGVYGIVAWSLYTKVSTGSGLPAGPSGLLGAVEGLSYLTVLACEYMIDLLVWQCEHHLQHQQRLTVERSVRHLRCSHA